MAGSNIELTVLMPCLNEAETIEVCIAKALGFFARANVTGEVLIADNGSNDGSQDLARKAGARVVEVAEKGYGAALAGGIAAAHGRFVIMGDADDSYDFSKLEDFVYQLRDGADLVMGNRFKGGIAPGAMPPLHRFLGNPVLSFAGRLFFRSDIGDFHCGLRGFKRQAIRDLNLRTTGMEFASEMVVKAQLSGLRIDEVPTTLAKDGRSRAPHLRSFRDGWRHLRFLLIFSPRWLFLYPGMVLTFVGLMGILMLGPGPFRVSSSLELDIHTLLLACMAVLLGIQGISFAVIGRRFASRYGFIPKSQQYDRLLEALTLERILIVAVLLMVGGGIGVLGAARHWALNDFGTLAYGDTFRSLLISVTGFVAGVQSMMNGFLASILNIPIYERRIADATRMDEGSDRRSAD